ncbi:hypothetical protein JAAARDRAFT_190291 [Jaapia argillacea MUCL 33604]|uniref:ZW10 C-terminal helical domain-containing protein n=1 Tax=Jaapia argillacea MUCL 33604 TaxID=933084 RepID=A0A067QDH8_9AGAM|nr:hypothetical protein JAAARDRAFT_190291 [Jaapia argillacea MUCL 33604]
MAFPVPSHLPRKASPQDVSTKVLTKISEATTKTLTAQLATSWVAELDDTIHATKKRLHERIQSDLPAFERQLSTSKSIQDRLRSLTSNVDDLSHALSNPESGLIPNLVKKLAAHAALTQQASDAQVSVNVQTHLQRCRSEFDSLTLSLERGQLPDAVMAGQRLEELIVNVPPPLGQAQVMMDLKKRYQTSKHRTHEQLDDAASRGLVVTISEIIIRPSVQVRRSETILDLQSILVSLSPTSLSARLNTIRRDLTTHYIDHILSMPTSVSITQANSPSGLLEHRLALFPSPPNTESRLARLESLSSVLTFLQTHIFSTLPPTQDTPFKQSLCKPITTALLNHLLIPSLPSALHSLPPFLELVEQAVEFEERYLVGMLGDTSHEKPVKSWSDGVSGQYERKRRMEILDRARIVIVRVDNESQTFRVEVVDATEAAPAQSVPEPAKEEETAWGFEDEIDGSTAVEEDGWGLDDDVEPQPDLKSHPEAQEDAEPRTMEDDPSDAWGWNEQEEVVPETDTNGGADPPDEADPWDDDPWGDSNSGEATRPPPAPTIPVTPALKQAKRLEKFTAKGKNGHANVVEAPAPLGTTRTTPLAASVPSTNGQSKSAMGKTTLPPPPPVVKETYLVSNRVRDILNMVNDVLHEGKELTASKIFPLTTSSSLPPGTLLLQSAPAVLDLFRALHPVTFSTELDQSLSRAMRFSNDCIYLSAEIGKLAKREGALFAVHEKLVHCQECLRVLGDSWFEDIIDNQRENVDTILMQAEGFVDTAEQDQFDVCENAVSDVLRNIRQVAQQWKPVLPKTKYYVAVGSMVDAALSKMLEDILALPDIPAEESHKLAELCRIFNALEGLFVQDGDQSSLIVVYVPSWLKFSYLSELLEASIADISYLFEEGALVDFEVDELVKLVKALFADTPLRTNTINKLVGGHPCRG